MIEASVSEAKASLSEYINRAVYQHERVLILSRGKPKAAISSLDDLRRFEGLGEAHGGALVGGGVGKGTRFYSVGGVRGALKGGGSAEVMG